MILGIAWYDKTQWKKMKNVAVDASALDDSYEDWLKQADEFFNNFSQPGKTLKKVHIKIDELVDWCKRNDYAVNAGSRSKFTTYCLRQNHK